MTSSNIENMIVRAISKLEDNSPEHRQKVYEAAVRSMFNAMADRPDNERNSRLESLKQSIIQIEIRYQEEISQQLGSQTQSGAINKHAHIEQTNNKNNGLADNLRSSGLLEFVSPFENWKANVVALGAVFFLFAGIGYAVFQNSIAEFSANNGLIIGSSEKEKPGSNKSPKQNESISAEKGNPVFDAHSATFLKPFRVQGKGDEYALKKQNDQQFVRFSGKARLIARNFISIRPDRIYHMTVEFRQGVGETIEGIAINAGFATFDAEKKIETQAPGRHRYFVSRGPVIRKATKSQSGWYVLSGIITGIDAKPNAFRQTSKFAKPIFQVNLGKNKIPVEVRSIKVVELQ